jgi:hypothetical protein
MMDPVHIACIILQLTSTSLIIFTSIPIQYQSVLGRIFFIFLPYCVQISQATTDR